ncbi:hypothetical protein [uncultured Roseovarius sp.]|uniref:hypothetical protein n=1 Tax=uncultured Roseovarius sp. TaxID=293344 RepID=UPI00262AB045|nr:hypothetical protein [uncultured Roseovarius sp.]
MKKIAISLSTMSALALANCTGATDPADATFFDNLVNTQKGGVYDQQIAAKEAEAAAIARSNSNTRTRINSLESQRKNNAATIASLRGQVSSVRAEIANARAKLAGDEAARARLAQLDRQAVAVQNDVDNGGDPGVARKELDQIRSTVRLLSS